MTITLTITNKTAHKLPATKKIKQAILAVLSKKKIKSDVIVGLKIVDKTEIKKLNQKYRGKNLSTDVLSFPIYKITPKVTDHPILLGDIVICFDVMAKNAKLYQVTDETEFLKLISHSTLHLLGFHHQDD